VGSELSITAGREELNASFHVSNHFSHNFRNMTELLPTTQDG
jgi:hypothetical protein